MGLHVLGQFSLLVVLLLVLPSSCVPLQISTFFEQSQPVMDSAFSINQKLEKISSYCEEKVCPEPFFKLDSECFYINDREKKNWTEARKACRDMGADLAEPEDFRSFLDVKYERVGNINLWLGLTDIAHDGVWVGVSGRFFDMISAPWFPGQPDNHGGNEDYLNVWNCNKLNDGKGYVAKYFACEYQLS